MIEMNHVKKKFGKKEILKDISCTIDNGVYGLLGPNGAGKTTLMRCMTNLYSLSGGNIQIDGVAVARKKQNNIGYLPQSFGLFKELSVYDSMRYFCNLKKIPKKEREEEIERCLRAVNMEENRKKTGRKLSGGMMRRVGVAQALLNHPKLVLFDEPTAGLDPEERMRFKNVVSGFGKEETIIISTHIVEDIEACCDKVIVMNEGKILCVKTCEELAAVARERVIACEKGKEDTIPCKYFIEKQYEKNGCIYYRVLLSEDVDEEIFEQMEPTIEDGYMAVVKGLAAE